MRFTPNNETLKRMKVLESPYLIAILKRMEGGATIRSDQFYWAFSDTDGIYRKVVHVRNVRTLETAGLIAPTEYEDYIEYNLTYSGKFEELVRTK